MDFTVDNTFPNEKGLSQSFDSPSAAKNKRASFTFDHSAKLPAKRECLKLKGSASERRYIDLGDDELKIERINPAKRVRGRGEVPR